MGQKIKDFSDGSYLEYDKGSFDEWCVYLVQPNGVRRPPRDVDYFSELKDLSAKYGVQQVYRDYVSVYDITGKKVSTTVFTYISKLAGKYGVDSPKVDILFSILYMAMIAEENRRYTRLGKRIKRLGIYALLIENRSVNESANFMRNMNWREIDKLCTARGF